MFRKKGTNETYKKGKSYAKRRNKLLYCEKKFIAEFNFKIRQHYSNIYANELICHL